MLVFGQQTRASRHAMRILVFQHVPVEHPGFFRQLWRENGDEWRTVELDEGQVIPDLNDFDLLVVMGGPMDVWQQDVYPWLGPEKAAIRYWVKDLGRPFLGNMSRASIACGRARRRGWADESTGNRSQRSHIDQGGSAGSAICRLRRSHGNISMARRRSIAAAG